LASLKDSEQIISIFEEALQKDISIVIGNAEMNTNDFLKHIDKKVVEEIINLNATSNCMLAAFFYNRLIQRAETKNVKSAFLFESGLAGYAPDSKTQMFYNSTKAFLRFFTLSLSEEANNHLDVLSVCPGQIRESIGDHLQGLFSVKPNECINGALKALGQRTETNTCGLHNIGRKILYDDCWNISHELYLYTNNKE
jgi:short-subunit dehydrogenase